MTTGFPGERVGLDIIGPLPISVRGFEYILVMVDYVTRWVEATPLLRQDVTSVANAITRTWISRWGAPLAFHSDCGSNFDSQLFKDVCDTLRINKTRTTPYHPEGNGLMERTNRTLHKLLLVFSKDSHEHDWDVHLPLRLLAYRDSVHSSTGFTPHYIWAGRDIRLPIDLLYPLPRPEASTPHDYATRLREIIRSFKANNLVGFIIFDFLFEFLGAAFFPVFDLRVDCRQRHPRESIIVLAVRGTTSTEASGQFAVLNPDPVSRFDGFSPNNLTSPVPIPIPLVHRTTIFITSGPRFGACTSGCRQGRIRSLPRVTGVLAFNTWTCTMSPFLTATLLHLSKASGALLGKPVFSKLGLMRVFYRIPIVWEDVLMTPVINTVSHIELRRVLFGLCNSSQSSKSLSEDKPMGLKASALYHPRMERLNSLEATSKRDEDDSLRFAFSLPCSPTPGFQPVMERRKSSSLSSLSRPMFYLNASNGSHIVLKTLKKLDWTRCADRNSEHCVMKWTETVLQVNYQLFKEGELMTYRTPVGLIGHLRTNCSTRTTPPDVPPFTSASSPTPKINTDRTPEPQLPSSSVASTSAATAPAPTATAVPPNAPTNIILTIANTSDVDSVHTCPHCDRTFISHIGLVGHLRIHLTETGEPVPGAPTYTRRIRLNRLTAPAHSLIAWVF
ncbi:hypothetical protein SprV_0301252900 [Sparganum proliferum]